MMELIAGLALGSLLGMAFGFWVGFSFIKKQLPELPKPDVHVHNKNEIHIPQRPTLQERKPLEQQRDGMAEFIEVL